MHAHRLFDWTSRHVKQFAPSLLVLAVLTLCAQAGRGQTLSPNHAIDTPSEQTKTWSEWMSGPDASLAKAQEAFESQAEWRTASRSCGEKAFARWAWWAEARGGRTASVPRSAWWQASENWRQTAAVLPPDEDVHWRHVAPRSVPTHGGAGRINRVRIDPHNAQHWYACAPAGGLWHSWDEGQTWDVFGVDVLAPLGVTDLWIDPEDADHLWLATGDGNGGDTYSIGILETTDGGANWAPLELSFEVQQGQTIHAIRPHRTMTDTVFVATDLGLFRTTNAGSTFDIVRSGNARDAVWINDSTAVVAIENVGLYRTTDVGENWVPCELPQTANSVGRIQLAGQSAGEAMNLDTLYAVAGHYFQQNFLAFWRSVDGGVTWTAEASREEGPNLLGYTVNGADGAGQAFWDLCIAVDPNNANRVLVGGVNLWETTDGGTTWNCPVHWQGASEAKYAHADQHSITMLEDGRIVLGNDGGVFVWEDGEVTDFSSGLDITQGYAMGIHPNRAAHLLVGTQDNGTTLVQPDFEARVLDGDGFHAFFDSEVDGRLYASSYYGLLYRSDDGGRTMTNIANYFQAGGPNEVGAWQTPFQHHPAVSGRIVAAKKSLHFSDDGGNTWTSWGGMGTVRSTALALSPKDPEAALVAKSGVVYWRDSLSLTFNEIDGLPGTVVGDVAIDSEDSGTWWVSFGAFTEGQQVWRTQNHGATWEDVSTGLPVLPVQALLQLEDGNWVCGSDLGVHLWNEETMSWSNLGTGLPLTPVVDIQEDATLHRVVVSTYGRGLWACPLPSAPAVAGTITDIMAPRTQCMGLLTGQPRFHYSGTQNLDEVHCVFEAQQGNVLIQDTVWTGFDSPLVHGDAVSLNAFNLEVPNAGAWEVTFHAWSPEHGELGSSLSVTLMASGLGHTSTLTWWGDCENVDMRWELREAFSDEVLLQSLPLSAADTVSQTWCLAEGCYELVWNDQGGDGFSGAYCGEPGGYALKGPFEDIISQAQGLDFGEELTVPFCVSVPWCYADFNGDGTRSVDDLLTMLSDFGCQSFCYADTDLDDSVGVSDLMNMLSVFGQGCSID